jgi:hypothetical protein
MLFWTPYAFDFGLNSIRSHKEESRGQPDSFSSSNRKSCLKYSYVVIACITDYARAGWSQIIANLKCKKLIFSIGLVFLVHFFQEIVQTPHQPQINSTKKTTIRVQDQSVQKRSMVCMYTWSSAFCGEVTSEEGKKGC